LGGVWASTTIRLDRRSHQPAAGPSVDLLAGLVPGGGRREGRARLFGQLAQVAKLRAGRAPPGRLKQRSPSAGFERRQDRRAVSRGLAEQQPASTVRDDEISGHGGDCRWTHSMTDE
jgi:hypothetical protein